MGKPTTWHRFKRGLQKRAASVWKTLGISYSVYQAVSGGGFALSSSGIEVTGDSALRIAAYKRAVELLSAYIGKTDFAVMTGTEEDLSHPAKDLVKFWARHHQVSSFEFRRVLMVHVLMRGNGYAYIHRIDTEPAALKILDPASVQPKLVRGELAYRVDGVDSYVSPSDMIHIKGLGSDGWAGLDPIRYYARDVLGLSIATQQYAASYYEQGGVPSAYITTSQALSDDQYNRMKAQNVVEGLKNPHHLPLLEFADIKSVSLSAEQTQLLASRQHCMLEIANLLGIPPHKLGLSGNSSYKSLEEENRAFRDDALDPWLCQFEMEYRKLLTEQEQVTESHRIEAKRLDLSKTNIKERNEALSKATGGSAWMTPNQAAKLTGLPSHPDGDTLHKPPTNEPKPAADTSAPAESQPTRSTSPAVVVRQLQALTDVYARMTKRLATEAVKRSVKSEQWPDYLAGLQSRHAGTITAALAPIVPLCGGDDQQADRMGRALIGEFEQRLSRLYDTATREEFAAEVSRAAETFQKDSHDFARKALLAWTAA